MIKVDRKTAIVTGGSRGIGKEISILLSKNNIDVIAIATSEESLKSIEGLENIHPFCCDISNEESVENLCSLVEKKFGYVDLSLIHI